jgi:hypothetical protein
MVNSTTWNNSTIAKTENSGLDAVSIVQSIGVFMLAGLFEIGGGWLVWGWLREGRSVWIGLLGGLVLAGYGAVATLQVHIAIDLTWNIENRLNFLDFH